jgi:mono/diheme cytochrome c family protein
VQVIADAPAAGNAANGKKLFAANCASCHGATGTEGGVGPSLKGEKSKKNTAAAVAWIKDPKPPMPKLFPSPLSAKDVNDVAAYVESL